MRRIASTQPAPPAPLRQPLRTLAMLKPDFPRGLEENPLRVREIPTTPRSRESIIPQTSAAEAVCAHAPQAVPASLGPVDPILLPQAAMPFRAQGGRTLAVLPDAFSEHGGSPRGVSFGLLG